MSEKPKKGFKKSPETQLANDGMLLDSAFKERRCQLTVLTGDRESTVVEVSHWPFSVGKDSQADLVLSDATVSREHFVIDQRGDGFVIVDSGSTNGTWIDQFRIREAYLRPGVVVRAGEVQIRFEPLFKQMEIAPSPAESFGPLIGRSVRMRQIFSLLDRVAKTDATMVILGETGSGKSAIARAVHDASDRGSGPFITVDCGAIAENLIESELFGHEKGAFTGATKRRHGALEQAQGGTLFIDELSDLHQDLQPKLLRALEEREIRRVGGNEAIRLDLRVIAASRKDLWSEVAAGRFREDLYFRLAIFTIPLPSLRERPEDIPMLAKSFAHSIKGGEQLLKRLTKSSLSSLSTHPFYGNVRELRNVIERAIYLDGDPNDFVGPTGGFGHEPTRPGIAPHDPAPYSQQSRASFASIPSTMPVAGVTSTPAEVPEAQPTAQNAGDALNVNFKQPFKEAKESLLDEFEAEYIKRLVAQGHKSASSMARAAGIDRKHLYTLAKKHNVDLK